MRVYESDFAFENSWGGGLRYTWNAIIMICSKGSVYLFTYLFLAWTVRPCLG